MVKNQLKSTVAIVGVFAIVGVGLGITGYISLDFVRSIFSGGETELARSIGQLFVGVVLLQSIFTTFFLGPTVAGITGLFAGSRGGSLSETVVVGGLGSFLGFYPMIIIAILVMSAAIETGGTGGGTGGQQTFDIANNIGRIAVLGIPTGVVGAISSAIVFWQSD